MTEKLLTEYESKIDNLSKSGKNIQEIADELLISHHCVKSVLLNVKRKSEEK